MISSVLSQDKDVVALVPVINMTAFYLKEIAAKVLILVHAAGYIVLSLISDNNRINRNMFTMLCGGTLMQYIQHPVELNLKLFSLFDTVHTLKCIRNNLIKQSYQVLTDHYLSRH